MKDQGRRETETHIPLQRLIIAILVFAAWSIIISVLHASIPRFDLISVSVAEIGAVPVLLLVVRQLSFTWGDKSATLFTAPIQGDDVEKAFGESAINAPDPVLSLSLLGPTSRFRR